MEKRTPLGAGADFLTESAGSAADFTTESAGSVADFTTESAGSAADFTTESAGSAADFHTRGVHHRRDAGRLRAVMMDASPRERWDVWMVQAQRFARRENYIDALGRVRLVLREVEEAIEAASGDERASLERYKARAERRADQIRAAFEAWNAKIAERRLSWIDAADEEMKRPLPLGPGEHI